MFSVSHLHGFNVSAGGGAAKTVAIFATASRHYNALTEEGSVSTITFPASIISGDLIVLQDSAAGSSAPSVTPSGFTQIGTSLTFSNTNSYRSNLWYKIATGTESGSLTVMAGVFDTTSTWSEMAVFRGSGVITGVSVNSSAQQGTSSTPTTQTVTSGSGLVPLIVLGGYGDLIDVPPNGVVNTRGMSPSKDAEISAHASQYLAYKIYNSSQANVDVSMNDEGNMNMLRSCYLQLTI